MKSLLLLLLLLLIPGLSRAGSIPDAALSCRVLLDGQEVTAVYETAVCHQRFWTAEPVLSTTPVAIAGLAGSCRVEVEFFGRDVRSALVRPLSAGIRPEIEDGKVDFTVPGAGNYTVEFNGQAEGALHLFLHESGEEPPDPESGRVDRTGSPHGNV